MSADAKSPMHESRKSVLETCIGLFSSTQDHALANRRTLADFSLSIAPRRRLGASSIGSPIPRAMLLGMFLRSSYEDTCNEHECSAKSHLHRCGEHWRIHEPVPHPCDNSEFQKDDDNCNPEGKLKLPDKKWEGVTNASQRRHGSANQTACPRVSAARKTPIIGKRFRKTHADAGSQRCSHSDQKGVPAVLRGHGRREYRGQR